MGHELFHTTVSHPFAGGIILVESYWWNHSIRFPQARAASPCSVNPNLVAGHELFHDCQPSILLLKKLRALKIAFSRVLITRESNPGLRLKYRRMQPPCSANRCIEVPIAAEILIVIVLMHYVYELVVSRHKTKCRACGFSHWGLPARCASGGSAPPRIMCGAVRIGRGYLPRALSQ